MTIAELKEKLDQFSDECVVECGYEGLTIYSETEQGHTYADKIDFGNERKRIQAILNDHNSFHSGSFDI